jgi:adenosylcobyric acid synthase
MNPVLLKPQSEVGAQVVVQGRVVGNARAREFQAMKPRLLAAVIDSFSRLAGEAELVLVEGAGSASEVNLREGDIANMGFARAADVPVILVADIDRGGVIASLVGTKAVIEPEDAAAIVGFIVNKFRGDPTLFQEGMDVIARRTGWRALGLVPFFTGAGRLPAEDALALDVQQGRNPGAKTVIAVLAYPRISNFDDFDPLRMEPAVDLRFIRPGMPVPADTALVILPGSKATTADLAALRATGWDIDIAAHVRRGGRVLGICGGYQMLGRRIADPEGLEGTPGAVDGLGLLDVETTLAGSKVLLEVRGEEISSGAAFRGYEMHVGRTSGPDCARPQLRLSDGRHDGAVSADGRVAGCYVHGLFTDDRQRASWLKCLGADVSPLDYEAEVESTLDALADHLERHIDCDRLIELARTPRLSRVP